MALEPRVILDFLGHSGHFRPHEKLLGQYRIEHVERAQLAAVEISVLWRTEGKGDEDLGIHFFKRYSADAEDHLDPVPPFRFDTELPDSPLSYDGLLIKIQWCVRARVFLQGGKDIVCERNFYLGDVRPPHASASPEPAQPLAY